MKKLTILFILSSFIAFNVQSQNSDVEAKGQATLVNRMQAFQPASVSLQSHHGSSKVIDKNYILGDISLSRSSHNKIDRSEQKSNNVSALLSKVKGVKKQRPVAPAKAKAFGFSFYSANHLLNSDLDGDGYYSDFSISFDADYDNGSANVYAVIYTSMNGAPWQELLVTNVFNIISNNASDEQSISTQLNFDFPTNEYDILIDLYEDGIAGIVATISSDQTVNLSRLPLEDLAHERASNQSQISYVATTLFGDGDGDGFLTNITLEYDIDTLYSGDTVYAEIVLTNPHAGWSQYLTTDNFILGNQTEFVDLALNSGYPAEWYDMQINLYNAFSGERIAVAGAGFLSLTSLPLESFDNDSLFDRPNQGGVDIVIGAGSFNLVMLSLLALLMIRRNRFKVATKAAQI